jgi:hypothetical protein
MPASWKIVPGAVDYAKVSRFMTRGSTCPASPLTHIVQSIMSNSHVGPPSFPALWFLCVLFCGVRACVFSTFDVSDVFCVSIPPLVIQARRRAGAKFPFPQSPLRKERRSACLRIRCSCKVPVIFGTSGQFKRGMPVSSSWTREAMAK